MKYEYYSGAIIVSTPAILTGAGSFLGKYAFKAFDVKNIGILAFSRRAMTVLAR